MRHNHDMDEIRLTLSVTGPDPDDLDDLDEAARSLRADLEEISDLRVSEVVSEEGAEGTRSGIVTSLVAGGGATMILAYYGGSVVRGVSKGIVDAIHNWQNRNKGKHVILRDATGRVVELHSFSEKGTNRVLETLKEEPSQIAKNE